MSREPTVLQPRVTPDPDQARQLEQKRQAVDFTPSNGFHRDTQQERRPRVRRKPN